MYKDSVEEYFCDMYEAQKEAQKKAKMNNNVIIDEFIVDDVATFLLRNPHELGKIIAALLAEGRLHVKGVTRRTPGYSYTTYSVEKK